MTTATNMKLTYSCGLFGRILSLLELLCDTVVETFNGCAHFGHNALFVGDLGEMWPPLVCLQVSPPMYYSMAVFHPQNFFVVLVVMVFQWVKHSKRRKNVRVF